VVRPLPAAHADPGKGGAGGEGRGPSGQTQYRRASPDPGPDGRAIDPGGIRLPGRPAGRRLHGGVAGVARERLYRAPGGRNSRRYRRRSRGPEAALAAGDVNTAAQAFGVALQADRENAQALAGLAKCYIKTGDLARAEQTLALVPPAKAESAPVASARAALELQRKAPSSGDIDQLHAKLAADPNDAQARFDLALALNAKGDRSGALEELLTLVAKNRAWNDDAARKQLVQLFDAWGGSDPVTVAGRQRLSSLLFA